jgi:hypothetical protein
MTWLSMAMSESLFLHEVDTRIRSILDVRSSIEFSELVTMLRGTDPVVVRQVIAMSPDVETRVTWTPLTSKTVPWLSRLPVPHPLDYDWRFTHATLRDLCNRISVQGSAALLGAPSVWHALHEEIGGPSAQLFDANASLLGNNSAMSLTLCDLVRDEIAAPSTGYDVVLADPPWYPDALRGFTWNAAQLVKMGGTILLSMPPLGTRPGIAEERRDFLSWVVGLGLSQTESHDGTLLYEMPPFERNALRALDLLRFVPHDWRAGDLLIFRRTGVPSVPKPRAVRADGTWTERVIQGVRFRVRIDIADVPQAIPSLMSIVDGDILSSVSRRDPRRAGVRVWTSGNRAFGCLAPRTFLRVLDAVLVGDPVAECEPEISSQVRQLVVPQVRQLVARERSEYLCE